MPCKGCTSGRVAVVSVDGGSASLYIRASTEWFLNDGVVLMTIDSVKVRVILVCLVVLLSAGCAHARSGRVQAVRREQTEAGRRPHAARVECQSGSVPLPPVADASSENLVADRGTGLEAYVFEGGAWLPHAPMLVNEEFDFAIAMQMDGIGAGLAARKRMDNNARKAAALGDLKLPAAVAEQLDELRACGKHAFFVLWGPASGATLKLVVDRGGADGSLKGGVVNEGSARPVTAEGGWAEPGALASEALRLMDI